MYSLRSQSDVIVALLRTRVFFFSLSLDDERKKTEREGRVCVENALYYDANWEENEQLSRKLACQLMR